MDRYSTRYCPTCGFETEHERIERCYPPFESWLCCNQPEHRATLRERLEAEIGNEMRDVDPEEAMAEIRHHDKPNTIGGGG